MLLDRDVKEAWKNALRADPNGWIACGIDGTLASLSDRLRGMAGLIDWRLHGQISALLRRGDLSPGEFCLVPTGAGTQNFLLYHYDSAPDAKSLATRAKKLGLSSLRLASSTFPKDFLSKLEQHLKKEGISFSHLEP